MLSVYPACFFKEESGYSVIFPDLNYLATCGDTLDTAMEMAIDCLAGYIYSNRLEGRPTPLPSDIKSVSLAFIANELEISSDGGFVNVIAVDVDEYAHNHFNKPVKKTLSIPYWLNKSAVEHNVNFSAVLQEALKDHLGIKKV